MRKECVEAVTKAAATMGRKLTQSDLNGIESRIRTNRRLLAEKDPAAYTSMPPEVQIQEAAKMAADQLLADKLRKKHNLIANATKKAAVMSALDDIQGRTKSATKALDYIGFERQDGVGNVQSFERRADVIGQSYLAKMGALMDLGDKGTLLNLFTDRAHTAAFVKELFGENSGIALAKQAAQQFKAVGDDIVKRLQYNGVPINLLEGYALPTNHSRRLVYKAGQDAWVEQAKRTFKRPLRETGSPMTDAEFDKFLRESWMSLAHNGAAKGNEGATVGRVGVAPAYAKHRQLHFQNADAWLEYHEKFSEMDAYSTVLSHIQEASKDIALTDILGSNPSHMWASLVNDAKAIDARADTGGKGVSKIESRAETLAEKYNFFTGQVSPVQSHAFSTAMRNWRNWKVASSMGSIVTSMVADQGTMIAIARQNKASAGEMYRFLAEEGFSPEARRRTKALGFIAESAATDIIRWGEQNAAVGITGKLASAVMRVSGANFMNSVEKNAFAKFMSHTIGDMVGRYETLADLKADDNRIVASKGITDADWAVWKAAMPEEMDGVKFLTPGAIERVPDDVLKPLGNPAELRREATLKLLGAIYEEVDTAILRPSLTDRFQVQTFNGALNPNSIAGELWKSVAQFKSFGWAYFHRHWDRAMLNGGAQSQMGYAASVVLLTTLFGGMGVALGDLANGKDPRQIWSDDDPMQLARFGRDAFLKGGGLGFYGDVLFSKGAGYGRGLAETFGGPTIADASKVWDMTSTALNDELSGDEKNRKYASKVVDLVKGNTPFQNLWYSKAATNRWMFNQLQESANPGYMSRVKENAMKNKSPYWWAPDSATPERAPNVGNLVGETP